MKFALLVGFSWFLFLVGCYIVFSCFVGVLRFKDFFIRFHAIKLSNIYGISLILLSQGLICNNLSTFIQLFLIIILNALMTLVVVHATCRVALNNNISHLGMSRRKYNEKLEEEKRKQSEQQNNN